MDECKPLPLLLQHHLARRAPDPGLTLVHFLTQRKRFLWNGAKGCIQELIGGRLGGD